MHYRLRTLLILLAAAPIWVYLIAILSHGKNGYQPTGILISPILLAGIATALYRLTRQLPDGLAIAVLLSPILSLGSLLAVAALSR